MYPILLSCPMCNTSQLSICAARYEYQAREVDSLFPLCRYAAEIMQSTIELAHQNGLRNMLEMQRQNSIYFEAVEEVVADK